MRDLESKLQIYDVAVVIVLFIVGCIAGRLVMSIYDSWLSFNIPAIIVIGIGEAVWWKIRKRMTSVDNMAVSLNSKEI